MLGRKVYGPVMYIAEGDDAVESGHGEYCAAGYDNEKLTMRPGRTPTVFTLQPLTLQQKVFVASCDGLRADTIAVQCALIGVSGWEIQDSTGRRIIEQPERVSTGSGEITSDRWMQNAHFDSELISELASVVRRISDGDPLS